MKYNNFKIFICFLKVKSIFGLKKFIIFCEFSLILPSNSYRKNVLLKDEIGYKFEFLKTEFLECFLNEEETKQTKRRGKYPINTHYGDFRAFMEIKALFNKNYVVY